MHCIQKSKLKQKRKIWYNAAGNYLNFRVNVINLYYRKTRECLKTGIPMYVRLIQAIAITAAFTGWIIYQMVVRKKRFFEIKDEVLFIAFFATVWLGIFHLLTN